MKITIEEPEQMEDEKKLPAVSTLAPEKQAQVVDLLARLNETVEAKRQLSIREDDLKEELEHIQKEAGLRGFRHGALIFYSHQVKGKSTLDRTKLLENGVTVAILNASTKVGKPYTRTVFKRLEEEA